MSTSGASCVGRRRGGGDVSAAARRPHMDAELRRHLRSGASSLRPRRRGDDPWLHTEPCARAHGWIDYVSPSSSIMQEPHFSHTRTRAHTQPRPLRISAAVFSPINSLLKEDIMPFFNLSLKGWFPSCVSRRFYPSESLGWVGGGLKNALDGTLLFFSPVDMLQRADNQ